VTGSAAEEVAWRGVSTYLAKGRTLPGIPEAVETPRAGEEWPEGLPEPSAQWRLGAGTGRAYADVSGDRNPIHLGALPAKAFGFPRAIAHGMYTAARALTEVTVDRPEAFTWQVAFGKPVLLPGTVSFASRVVPGSGSGSVVPASTGTPEAPTGVETSAGPATSRATPAGGSTEFVVWHPRPQRWPFSGRVDRHRSATAPEHRPAATANPPRQPARFHVPAGPNPMSNRTESTIAVGRRKESDSFHKGGFQSSGSTGKNP